MIYIVNVGDLFVTNEGCKLKVIKNIGNKVRVMFIDEYKFEKTIYIGNLLRGEVKNPYRKSVLGVGCIGETKVSYKRKVKKSYIVWAHMIRRCYVECCPEYKRCGGDGVYVCDEWLIFSNYEKWYDSNYIEGFEVDKDILQNGEKIKVYSPSTCMFVSKSENIKNRDHFRNEFSFYETNSVFRSSFKRKCYAEKIKTSYFNETFDKYHVDSNGNETKRKKYFYKLKEMV